MPFETKITYPGVGGRATAARAHETLRSVEDYLYSFVFLNWQRGGQNSPRPTCALADRVGRQRVIEKFFQETDDYDYEVAPMPSLKVTEVEADSDVIDLTPDEVRAAREAIALVDMHSMVKSMKMEAHAINKILYSVYQKLGE